MYNYTLICVEFIEATKKRKDTLPMNIYYLFRAYSHSKIWTPNFTYLIEIMDQVLLKVFTFLMILYDEINFLTHLATMREFLLY